MLPLKAQDVKRHARQLGADLVGIAFPRDPRETLNLMFHTDD